VRERAGHCEADGNGVASKNVHINSLHGVEKQLIADKAHAYSCPSNQSDATTRYHAPSACSFFFGTNREVVVNEKKERRDIKLKRENNESSRLLELVCAQISTWKLKLP
jgi:hypothetical protein